MWLEMVEDGRPARQAQAIARPAKTPSSIDRGLRIRYTSDNRAHVNVDKMSRSAFP
jgi:hypothetical protein